MVMLAATLLIFFIFGFAISLYIYTINFNGPTFFCRKFSNLIDVIHRFCLVKVFANEDKASSSNTTEQIDTFSLIESNPAELERLYQERLKQLDKAAAKNDAVNCDFIDFSSFERFTPSQYRAHQKAVGEVHQNSFQQLTERTAKGEFGWKVQDLYDCFFRSQQEQIHMISSVAGGRITEPTKGFMRTANKQTSEVVQSACLDNLLGREPSVDGAAKACSITPSYMSRVVYRMFNPQNYHEYKAELMSFIFNISENSTIFFIVCSSLQFIACISLLQSKRPVEAIFSFLMYLLITLFVFFDLFADYIGAIHLLIYPGAILIFFVFATLTTDQRGVWNQWYTEEKNSFYGIFELVFFAFTLTLIWCNLLSSSYTGSNNKNWSRIKFAQWDTIFFDQSTSLNSLGSEIFGKYIFSLNLLGLLLLITFLGALKLLNTTQQRSTRAFFPKFGAFVFPFYEINTTQKSFYENIGYTFTSGAKQDAFLLTVIVLIATSFACLGKRRYTFLHTFLIIESIGILINLFYIIGAQKTGTLDGEVFVVFTIAIAAAETAIGLSLFIALTFNSASKKSKKKFISRVHAHSLINNFNSFKLKRVKKKFNYET